MDSPHWFVRNRLKTRQLWLLVAIYDHKSIVKAADALGMTQPGASKLLREIEDVLQVPLFERMPRGMQATWYGEIMVRHARTVLRSLNSAWDEVADWKSGRSGHAAIGSIMAPAISILPQAIELFHRDSADARVSVVVDSSDVLLPRLAQASLDIMIGRLLADGEKKYYDYLPLTEEEPLTFLARAANPLHKKRNIEWGALAQAPWVVPPRGGRLRHRFDMLFREQGVDSPAKLVEATELQTLVAIVQSTDMLTILPTEAAQHCLKSGLRALRIPVSCTMDGFGIITRSGQLPSPTAAKLLVALRAAGEQHYGLKSA
jgi:DNA-binding transcriptional LysR family regulator